MLLDPKLGAAPINGTGPLVGDDPGGNGAADPAGAPEGTATPGPGAGWMGELAPTPVGVAAAGAGVPAARPVVLAPLDM